MLAVPRPEPLPNEAHGGVSPGTPSHGASSSTRRWLTETERHPGFPDPWVLSCDAAGTDNRFRLIHHHCGVAADHQQRRRSFNMLRSHVNDGPDAYPCNAVATSAVADGLAGCRARVHHYHPLPHSAVSQERHPRIEYGAGSGRTASVANPHSALPITLFHPGRSASRAGRLVGATDHHPGRTARSASLLPGVSRYVPYPGRSASGARGNSSFTRRSQNKGGRLSRH